MRDSPKKLYLIGNGFQAAEWANPLSVPRFDTALIGIGRSDASCRRLQDPLAEIEEERKGQGQANKEIEQYVQPQVAHF